MRINEDYLDKVTADEMSDDILAVDVEAEDDIVLSPDEWYQKAVADGYDTLIVLGTECSASEEITDDTRPKIIENIKRRMQRIMDNTCEHSPIQVVYAGYDEEMKEQLAAHGIVYERSFAHGGILPADYENQADQLFYKVCIKRTTVGKLLDLIGSLQNILPLSKGDSDYEFIYLYRYENEHFIVIEDEDIESGIHNWITGIIKNYRLCNHNPNFGRVSDRVAAKCIADDLYEVGVFRELGKGKLIKTVYEWIKTKIKAAEKK